jgi:hypothetical protein
MFYKVYNLRNDDIKIRITQEASLSKNTMIGLKIENGFLYGSNEWFCAINNRIIKKNIITGYISRKYISGHNDYPEFEVTEINGTKTIWEIKGNDTFYIEGRKIKILYVPQKFKMGKITNCIIEISIDMDI